MGYFDPDCATVEVDLVDGQIRPRGPQSVTRSAPPPVPTSRHQDAQYAAEVQAFAQLSHLQQIQMQQQMQLHQLQQLQMAQQPVAAAQTARSMVDPEMQAQQDNDNRLKFLLFGLAIGAVVVLLLSGNGLSNLRARLAYALMPDAPAVAPTAPATQVAAMAAAPVAPPPTAIPVVAQPTAPPTPVAVAPAAPREVPEVDVAHLPKSGRGSRTARKQGPTEIPASQAGIAPPPAPPPAAAPPEEPAIPGADPGIDMKAFEALGKAFKTD